MKKTAYQKLNETEYFHWWNVGRRRILERALRRHVPANATGLRILDVGCGTGGNMLFLGKFGQVTGLDINNDALAFSRNKGFSALFKGEAEKIPFQNSSFDIISTLDCIEHIEDDRAALREISRILKNTGTLLLTVPAHTWLWSRHDEALHHKRRYTGKDLREKIESAGFKIVEMSHFVVPAIPFLLFQKTVRGIKKHYCTKKEDDIDTYDYLLPRPLNALLIGWLAFECAAMRIFPIPFGSSLLVIARKESREGGTQYNAQDFPSRK